jgi:LPXTG-motif cell wall-anchored protein
VEGAVFQLFRDSACKIPAKDSNDNTITATSDGNGKVSFTNVRTGIYFLKEISVPEPYEVNDTVYRVKISKQGSSMSVNSDQDNNPVTEVINIKPDDITVIKKWYDAEGKEVSGEGYPATVQLRRYHYVRTGATPETHSVTLHFHFPDAGWNQPNVDFGPYTITGNSVVITWTVGGCDFYWDSDYSQKITDSSGANLLQIPLDQDLVLDIYGERDWASSNLSTVSVDGAFDDSKELRQDESFPSEMEVEKATQTLTSSSYMHAWSLGTGEEYDFPVGDELGDYLYYVVELDENGNAIEIGDEAVNGMTLKSIEYNPAKTDGLGITHGVITVKNELPRPQSINVVIKKTDDAENSTNYLAGAVFKLVYRENSDGTYANVSNTAVPELDTNSQFTVPTAGITLTGLVDGQYQLQEISPPSGYVITNNYPVTFTVSGGAITSTDGSITGVRYIAASQTTNAEFIIPNTPGAALPNTGGPGTRLFTILGSILILGAGVLLWRRRRLI